MPRVENLEGYQWRVERVLTEVSPGENQLHTRLTLFDPATQHAVQIGFGDEARGQLVQQLMGGIEVASMVPEA